MTVSARSSQRGSPHETRYHSFSDGYFFQRTVSILTIPSCRMLVEDQEPFPVVHTLNPNQPDPSKLEVQLGREKPLNCRRQAHNFTYLSVIFLQTHLRYSHLL
ncbi:hypothetical protein QQ045_031285 [Rhodiola kirilowii]